MYEPSSNIYKVAILFILYLTFKENIMHKFEILYVTKLASRAFRDFGTDHDNEEKPCL